MGFPDVYGDYSHDGLIGDGNPYNGTNVADCETAILILSAQSHNPTNGKKKPTQMSNDPTYMLARALLAYKLNIAAGASTCPDAQQAEIDADAFLNAYEWDGTETYLGGKGKKAGTPEEREAVNEVAGILDDYNNNLLCP